MIQFIYKAALYLFHGTMPHALISRYGNHVGLGYQALIVNWMNWLVMEYPDAHNDSIVVNLRGVDFTADPLTGLYITFVRSGANRFIISPEQAVFWPIIMYFVDQNHHQNADTPVHRLEQLIRLMRGSQDSPPGANQALISENGGPPVPIRAAGYANHRFVSDIDFELQIPQQDYSNRTSLCTLLDVPLTRPGRTYCRIGGYFLLLTFTPGTYIIISHGHGEMGYVTSTYVEIEVTAQRNAERFRNQLRGVLP